MSLKLRKNPCLCTILVVFHNDRGDLIIIMESTAHDLRPQPAELPAEAVREQLARILASPAFDVSERLKDFLSFVVEETLAGRQESLKGYTIATTVFRRGEDFDAGNDPIVSIEANKLRKALERYYLLDGVNDSIRIQIPKGAYVPIFEHRVSSTTALANEEIAPKIVVMPLELLNHDPEQEYFAAGLTEELTTALTYYKEIQVIASESARYLHQMNLSPQEIGRELKAHFLLKGCVRKHVTTVKVSMTLIDTHTGVALWSEHYRRNLTVEHLIELQEEIAGTVASKIGGEYGILAERLFQESRRTSLTNLSVYEAFLKFYHYKAFQTSAGFESIRELLEQALKREPEDGFLWAALSNVHTDNYLAEFSPTTTSTLEEAERYARKGVVLDPTSARTRMQMAYIHFLLNDREMFFQEAEHAFRLNPNNAYIYGTRGHLEILFGNLEHGLQLLQKAIVLNPYHPNYFFISFFLYAYAHQNYRNAYKEAVKFDPPGVYLCPLYQAAALGQLGQTEEAEATLETLVQLRPDFPARAHELIGRLIKAEGQVDHIIEGLQKAGLRLEEHDGSGKVIPF